MHKCATAFEKLISAPSKTQNAGMFIGGLIIDQFQIIVGRAWNLRPRSLFTSLSTAFQMRGPPNFNFRRLSYDKSMNIDIQNSDKWTMTRQV